MSNSNTTNTKVLNITVNSFISSIIINSIVGGVVLLIFFFLRPIFSIVYTPKTSATGISLKRCGCGSLVLWIHRLFVGDTEMLHRAGLTGFALYSFCRLMCLVFLVMSAVSGGTLLPLTIFFGDAGLQGMDRFTMANVSDEKILSAHLLVSWACLTILFFGVFFLLRTVASLRREYLLEQSASSLGGRTILVRDVPKKHLSVEELTALFSPVGHVEKVVIASFNTTLARAVKQAEKLQSQLEAICVSCLREITLQARKAKRIKPNEADLETGAPDGGAANPKIEKMISRIENMAEKYREVLVKVRQSRESYVQDQNGNGNGKGNEVLSSAFVVFANEIEAGLALRALVLDHPTTMTERHVVGDSENILWGSLRVAPILRLSFSFLGTLVALAITIFWGFAIGYVSQFTSLSNLNERIPQLQSFLDTVPGLSGFLTGFLPPLVVAILTALVPPIFREISVLEANATVGEVESQVLFRYYCFLVFNVLLVVTFTNSALDSLTEIAQNPFQAFSTFANRIPPTANFFLTYTMLQALTGPALALLQAPNLVIRTLGFMGLFGEKPPRSKRMLFSSVKFDFAVLLSMHCLIATVAIVFAVLAPILLGVVTVYFGFWTLVYMYLIQHVYESTSGVTATAIYSAAMQLFAAIFISQITLIGVFLAKGATAHAIAIGVQILVTIWMVLQAQKFKPLMSGYPVEAALQRKRLLEARNRNHNPSIKVMVAPAKGVPQDVRAHETHETASNLDFDMLSHPTLRKHAMYPLILPNEPLETIQSVILPALIGHSQFDIVNFGDGREKAKKVTVTGSGGQELQIVLADAQMTIKGKITLGEGMVDVAKLCYV
ncbi:hypothetical protein BJ742DRAFT_568300 [Cladochytrium replicatum]|nr:hypothetical protein BJ742DRAFT_568300 [Cladochytrium replicatum]